MPNVLQWTDDLKSSFMTPIIARRMSGRARSHGEGPACLTRASKFLARMKMWRGWLRGVVGLHSSPLLVEECVA